MAIRVADDVSRIREYDDSKENGDGTRIINCTSKKCFYMISTSGESSVINFKKFIQNIHCSSV